MFTSPTTAALASCGSSGHSYVAVDSGSGSTVIGTGGWTWTWPSGYSLHKDGSNFSNEAQWLYAPAGDNCSGAASGYPKRFEGGFFTGAGAPGSGLWSDGIIPYFTTCDGYYETDDGASNDLAYNNNIWVSVTMSYGGNSAEVKVGSHDMWGAGSYAVPSPPQNVAQAEAFNTNNYQILMGGSSSSPGEQWNESWEDTSYA